MLKGYELFSNVKKDKHTMVLDNMELNALASGAALLIKKICSNGHALNLNLNLGETDTLLAQVKLLYRIMEQLIEPLTKNPHDPSILTLPPSFYTEALKTFEAWKKAKIKKAKEKNENYVWQDHFQDKDWTDLNQKILALFQ